MWIRYLVVLPIGQDSPFHTIQRTFHFILIRYEWIALGADREVLVGKVHLHGFHRIGLA